MPESDVPSIEEDTSFEWQTDPRETDPERSYSEMSPDLDWAYEPLENLVKLVTAGIEDFVMLNAPGGLGKTHNIKGHLRDEIKPHQWAYQAGHTSPMELYKTLYKNRNSVLFLDDMSGITKNDRCLEILKAATDTEGEANRINWNTSKTITNDYGREIPKMFYFQGSVIMSFNEIPDKDENFRALASRGQDYAFDLTYQERINVLKEVIKNPEFHEVRDYSTRLEMVEWIETVTNPAIEVNIRTLEKLLNIKLGAEKGIYEDWERTALEVFDLDYEMYLIKELHESDEYDTVTEQANVFAEEVNRTTRHYYDKKAELEQKVGTLD